MKRLISWLLVLAMAIACLPMSAFAVEVENGDGDPDIDVGFEELLHGYNANDPIDLTADLRPDFTATVTVPAGKTMYFTASNVGGMEMTINGENKGVCVAAPRQPYAWSITNDGAEDAEYVITVAFPVGHQMNPEVIEELAYSSFDVEQAAGDIDGYFYTYTAPAAGTVTLYISNVPEVEVQAPEYDEDGGEITPAVTEKFVGDITVLNENTYANYVLSQDGVDNYGLELQIPVAAGDVLNINTALVADNEDNYYPAGTYSWTGNFTYPAGTEQNPIAIEWTWNEEYTTATASVTVPEGATQYFTGKAGMILTANGEEIAMDAAGTFALPAGTYELKMATPVGAQANPEVIENIDGYSDSNSLEADGAYYYIWTATEDGTVTLDVTDGANITVDKLTYVEDSEWPISEQFQLAEPAIDENWNYTGWTVAENLQIEVVAGQQLKIQVNGLTDWATWTVPAIDYTLTGSFEAAEPEISVDENLKFYRANSSGGDLMLGDDIRATFMLKVPTGYGRIYLEITKDGVTTYAEKNELSTDTVYRYAYVVPAAHMTMDINVTIWGEKDGVTYRGEELVFSIRRCAEAKLGAWINNSAAAGQCKLLMNMLYYGEKAQLQFGINTDTLATAGLAEKYTDLITKDQPSLKGYPTVDETGMDAKIYNMGFMLQEKVKLSVYFKLNTAITNADEYTVEVKHIPSKTGATPVTYTYTSADFQVTGNSKNMILFFFDKIAPSQMRDDVEYTVYHNGEAISATYVRPMENVAQYYAEKSPALADLIYAIMNYADAAKAVFG